MPSCGSTVIIRPIVSNGLPGKGLKAAVKSHTFPGTGLAPSGMHGERIADVGVDRQSRAILSAPPTSPRNNRQEKETAMSTRKVLTLASMVAMLFSPAVFSADAASDAMDNSFQVLGESLDSGLGDLSPSYTAAEFQRYRVAGESLDSGVGDLSPAYTGAEFQKYRVAGESLDSGLGDLSPSYTAAEFQKKQLVAAR